VGRKALRYRQCLFWIEREIEGLPSDERRQVRQRWSWLVLAVFHRWLLAQRQWVRPGSATFKAIDCAVKRWQKLVSFADDDDMPVSNNWVGNHIRPNAQGIANWLFIDGLRAGQLAAGSCHHALAAFGAHQRARHLRVLQGRPSTAADAPDSIDALLPHR
jgi:hypothetical protein